MEIFERRVVIFQLSTKAVHSMTKTSNDIFCQENGNEQKKTKKQWKIATGAAQKEAVGRIWPAGCRLHTLPRAYILHIV